MDPVSTDTERQAILVFCAPGQARDDSARPLTPKAWHSLVESLARNGKAPGDLLGLSANQIQSEGGLDVETANRLTRLADRAGPLALEVDRLDGRGVWVITEADDAYPQRLRERLGSIAPPLLFGSGRRDLLATGGLAIVGSRDAGDKVLEFTAEVAAACARGGLTVLSGAARGVDSQAMNTALDHAGQVVGVLADSLERRIRDPAIRRWMSEDQLCLVTPYGPDAGFSVGSAMGRNKVIYALSEAALVVTATEGSGGTWAGAIEALDNQWTPVLVAGPFPGGGAVGSLMSKGALPFPTENPDVLSAEGLEDLTTGSNPETSDALGTRESLQVTLFGEAEPVAIKKPRRRSQRGRT